MGKQLKWFVTNGVPGGEYAAKADDMENAWNVLQSEYNETHQYIECKDEREPVTVVRPAPPDLAEWLDAVPSDVPGLHRDKVPGGWMYYTWDKETDNYDRVIGHVQVPLAGGITVLKGEE